MPSLTSSAVVYIAAATLNAAVPFVVLPMLARWLGPAGFGVVGSYLAVLNIAAVLAGLSVHGIVSVVHFKQDPQAVPSHVRAALRVLLLTGIPLVTLLWAFGRPLEAITGVPSGWLWTAGIAAIGQFIVSLALAIFQTREQPLRYGALQIGLALSWGVLSLILIGLFHWSWTGRAIAQVVAVIGVASAALWLLYREGMLDARSRTAPLASILRFGVPLLPHSLAAALMTGADRLLLTAMGGNEIAGQYFAAFQMAAVITVAAAALNQAWVPWLYRRLAQPSAEGSRAVVRTTYCLYALLLGASGMLALSAPWVVPLVAGDRYERAVPLLRWLAPAAALSGMYYFVTNYLFYSGRTGLLSLITVSCSVIQLGLMALWVPHRGAEGAAGAVLVTSFLYWLWTWGAAHKVLPMPWGLRMRTGVL
jgi:O-antigen/teichoic acid export membrane protein